MENLLLETKQSYYEYIRKINTGCIYIANELRIGNINEALSTVVNLAEGLQWLLSVEELMKKNEYIIKSRISEVNEYLNEINEALGNNDYVQVADLFEYEIQPIFSSASEWIFEKIEK